MKMQFKMENGQSIWNLTGFSCKSLTYGEPDDLLHDPWVEWQGRTWLCKREDKSICEVVGYQIAEALEIPLQPWTAFFQTKSDKKPAPKSLVGILVEKWPHFHWEAPLWCPANTHSDLVSRAMALAVLDRSEWPQWLMDEGKNNLRLFDLERIGPFLDWPPQRTRASDYGKETEDMFDYALGKAKEAGVLEMFLKYLDKIKTMDFSSILDFSGHPHAEIMKRVIIRGLLARQKELCSVKTK